MKGGKGNVVDNIRKMEEKRQERRAKAEEAKKEKEERRKENLERGKNVDIDYEYLIEKNRYGISKIMEHTTAKDVKLCVCVRKRPIFKKEQQSGEIDSVSCANPQIKIHEPKYKVDGITKYIENHQFAFDNTFNQTEDSAEIYRCSLKEILPSIVESESVITCFAYGQTGSGKTYTMRGMTEYVVADLFELIGDMPLCVSSFQIYGGRCYDLLNEKALLTILEDKNSAIQIHGLYEQEVSSPKELYATFQLANSNRTTHATVANDTSSRSHSITNLVVKDPKTGQELGKLTLVDLAGSQRAQDTQSNNQQRRIEGAQINKSLLALKECIRAMDEGASHVPFRSSKLTLVLRDSFLSKSERSKIVMIACISPGSSSADHSLNTLRYADRLKDKSGVKLIDPAEYIERAQKEKEKEKKHQVEKDRSREKERQKDKPAPKHTAPKRQEKMPIAVPLPKETPKQADEKKVSVKVVAAAPKEREKIPSGVGSSVKLKPKERTQAPKPLQVDFDAQNIELKEKEIARRKAREDVSAMRQTMKGDQKKMEYLDYQQKVTTILDEQEEIFILHIAAMKEDARLLAQQSELISEVQTTGLMDYDIEKYASSLESVIRKKLKMYNMLSKKLQKFKSNLKEEEEISSKVKQTFYF